MGHAPALRTRIARINVHGTGVGDMRWLCAFCILAFVAACLLSAKLRVCQDWSVQPGPVAEEGDEELYAMDRTTVQLDRISRDLEKGRVSLPEAIDRVEPFV